MDKSFEKLVEPVKELNDLTLKSIEAIAAVQVKSIQENARASMEALKASTDIKDFESLQSYLEDQARVAQGVSKTAMEDAQEIAKLSEAYANDVKDLISKSILA